MTSNDDDTGPVGPRMRQLGGAAAARLRRNLGDADTLRAPAVRVSTDDLRMVLGELNLQLGPLGNLPKNSVVLARYDNRQAATMPDPALITSALRDAVGHHHFQVIAVADGITLDTLPAAEMAAAGWFRKPF